MFKIFSCLLLVWSIHDSKEECPPIIGRKEWDAVKPQHQNFLEIPIDLVVIQHTVTQTCSNDKSCAEIVRELQKVHIEQSYLWDIAHSFLVGGTGKLYEGRGWHHVGIHTPGYNNQSIGIAFIGNFNNQDPSPKALDAVQALIQCGVDQERLTPKHKVVVHSQLVSTDSPGKKLASKVMSWPDWINDVSEIKKRADKDLSQNSGLIEDRSGTDNNVIWNNPKEIDSLSKLRDVITELTQNMKKLANETVGVFVALTTNMSKKASLFFETLTLDMKKFRDQIGTASSAISGIPGVHKCSNPLKEQANTLYSDIEAKSKICANDRIKEINDTVTNLGKLSSDAIDYTNTAVDSTKNCTELHYGITPTTKACLVSVTQQTKTASDTYQAQRKTALTSINTLLTALPAALDLCAKQHLLKAGIETPRFVSEISKCPINSIQPFYGGFRRQF